MILFIPADPGGATVFPYAIPLKGSEEEEAGMKFDEKEVGDDDDDDDDFDYDTDYYKSLLQNIGDSQEARHHARERKAEEREEAKKKSEDQRQLLAGLDGGMPACADLKTGIHIQPRRGKTILFYNQLPNGTLDHNSFHGGCPVLKGEKWAANIWIWSNLRPNQWQGNTHEKKKTKEELEDDEQEEGDKDEMETRDLTGFELTLLNDHDDRSIEVLWVERGTLLRWTRSERHENKEQEGERGEGGEELRGDEHVFTLTAQEEQSLDVAREEERGRLKSLGTISPHLSLSLNTFTGHRFLLRELEISVSSAKEENGISADEERGRGGEEAGRGRRKRKEMKLLIVDSTRSKVILT